VAQRRDETLAAPPVRRTETAARQQLEKRQFEPQLLRIGRAARRLPNNIKPSQQSGSLAILQRGHQTTYRTSSTHSTTTLHKVRVRIESWAKRLNQSKHPTRLVDFEKKEDYQMCLVPMYNRRSDERRDCINCTTYSNKIYPNISSLPSWSITHSLPFTFR
jgi:hypothetical protein